MHVTFIVNMRAGNYKGRRIWQRFKQQLTIPYSFFETKYVGHATEIVQQLALNKQQHLVIVIGGDGTIHEVVNGAVGQEHIILGYVKGGSGNDFARAFTCFEHAAAVEQFMNEQSFSKVDSGQVVFNDHEQIQFINNFGIGFDGFVCQLVNESTTKKLFNKVGLGKISYAYFVAQALIQFKPFMLTVQQNNSERVFKKVWFVTVSNQPYFGGGMNLSPTSKVDDAVLEVTVVDSLPKLKFLALFLTVFKGKHTKFKEVTQFQIQRATFTTDALVAIHTDGENKKLTSQQVHCDIAPKSIIIAK